MPKQQIRASFTVERERYGTGFHVRVDPKRYASSPIICGFTSEAETRAWIAEWGPTGKFERGRGWLK